jgi:hypothetical protein
MKFSKPMTETLRDAMLEEIRMYLKSGGQASEIIIVLGYLIETVLVGCARDNEHLKEMVDIICTQMQTARKE